MQLKLDKGIIIEKLNIKDGDTLVVTFDTDIWDIEECQSMFKIIAELFPNNNILCKFKGIDLEIKEKGHWIEHPHEAGLNLEYSRYECSKCHEWHDYEDNYCPNCGIEMELK